MTEYEGPELNTVESVIEDTVNRVLGTLLTNEKLGKLLGSPLSDTLTDALPKSLRSAVTSTSLTPEGVYMRSRRSRINAASKKTGTAYLRQSTIHTFETLQRIFNTQERWEASPDGKTAIEDIYAEINSSTELNDEEQAALLQKRTAEAYNKYITNRATSHYDTLGKGKVYETINSAFGFTDAPATAGNLQATARNVATNAYDKNISDAIDASKIITGHLFTTPKTLAQYLAMEKEKKGSGSLIKRFDASEWGGMSSSAVSGLAQELTRSTDVLAGVNTSDADSVRQAAFRFRETVRGYAKALEPLKDVFGDDIKKMTKLMETMSGQSLPQMSAAAVDSISARIATGMSNGTFNAQDLLDMTKGVRRRMRGMKGLDPFHYTGIQAQAVTASEVKGGPGGNPYWRTESQWDSAVEYFITDTLNSSGADVLNKGLVLYVEKQGGELTADNMVGWAKEYGAAINAAMKDPRNRRMSFERVAMSVAGALDQGDLNAAMGKDGLRHATQGGATNYIALGARAKETVDKEKLSIIRDKGFRKALGNASREEASRIYDKATSMVMDNPELLAAKSKEDKIRVLQHIDKQMRPAEAEKLATAITFFIASRPGLGDMLLVAGNANKAAAAAEQAEKRRSAFKQAGINLFGSMADFAGSAARDVDDTIKKIKNDANLIQAIGDALGTSKPDAKAAAIVAMLAATDKDDALATVESLIQGTGKNAEDIKKAFGEFKALKEKRDEARKSNDDSRVRVLNEEMQLKALQIQAYKEGDVEAVNAILNDKDTDDETKQDRLRNYLEIVDKKDASKAITAAQKAWDKLRPDRVTAALEGGNKDAAGEYTKWTEIHRNSVQSFIKEASAAYIEYRATPNDPTTTKEFAAFLTDWAETKKASSDATAVEDAVKLIQTEIENSKKDADKGALDTVDALIAKFADIITKLLEAIEKWRGDTTGATKPDLPAPAPRNTK